MEGQGVGERVWKVREMGKGSGRSGSRGKGLESLGVGERVWKVKE